MALVYSVNVATPQGGASTVWNLITVLVAAGWTIVDSNDSTGNPITDAVSLDTGTNAWITLQDPVVGRQLCFIRGANHYTWTTRYSRGGLLSGGGTGTPPTAPDDENIYASSQFNNTVNTCYAHAVAENVAWTANYDVYPFWFGATLLGSGSWQGGGIMAPINLGTPALDQDPCVFSFFQSANFLSDTGWRKWTNYNRVGQTWNAINRCALATFGTAGDPYGRGVPSIPSIFFDNSGDELCGASGWIQRCNQGSLSYPDTRNLAIGPTHVFGAGTLLPWPVGVTPLV